MDHSDPVTVFITNKAAVAQIVKNLLETEGIKAMVAGESQAGFAGVLEIPVQVPAADEARARELIESHGHLPQPMG